METRIAREFEREPSIRETALTMGIDEYRVCEKAVKALGRADILPSRIQETL